jgi:ferritin
MRRKKMLDKKVRDLINEQITKELYSGYLYLDFANYYYDQGLDGFANWYDVQAQEERDHAMMMRTYLLDNGEKVELLEIAKPDREYNSLSDPLKYGLEHEQYVTSLINTIYKAARDVDDFRTMQFFDWFVKEQLEEEKNADELIKKFELFGSDPNSLYALNQELLSRVHTAPSIDD